MSCKDAGRRLAAAALVLAQEVPPRLAAVRPVRHLRRRRDDLQRVLRRRLVGAGGIDSIGDAVHGARPGHGGTLPFIFILFFANFLILFGPLLLLGVQQIKGYEPGDADWGVKLADVRGQAEAKEEITRVVSLWQSGEEFEKAGGKRERGVLFLGAPGTGKTMLSKGIATSFNCPFVTIPGSGFAQTFIGMDAVIVRYLASKAKKLAAQVGRPVHRLHRRDRRRRHAPPGAGLRASSRYENGTIHDLLFYGPDGALTASGDLVLETRRLARPPVQHARRAAAARSTRRRSRSSRARSTTT